jgi:hypothetical protein
MRCMTCGGAQIVLIKVVRDDTRCWDAYDKSEARLAQGKRLRAIRSRQGDLLAIPNTDNPRWRPIRNRRRLEGIDTGYMLGALIVVVVLWVAVS